MLYIIVWCLVVLDVLIKKKLEQAPKDVIGTVLKQVLFGFVCCIYVTIYIRGSQDVKNYLTAWCFCAGPLSKNIVFCSAVFCLVTNVTFGPDQKVSAVWADLQTVFRVVEFPQMPPEKYQTRCQINLCFCFMSAVCSVSSLEQVSVIWLFFSKLPFWKKVLDAGLLVVL